MLKQILSILLFLNFLILDAQPPIFHKYPVAETGYEVYFPKKPGEFVTAFTTDSLMMYMGNVDFSGIEYDLILKILGDKYKKASKEELEKLLISNLDLLKGTYNVVDTTGYVKGQKLKAFPDVTGIFDNWKDNYGSDIIIKGWVNNNVLVVLVVTGNPLPPYDFQSLFLNRFGFKKN